jgi:uncharacterized protein (TIGR02231 family)
MWKRHVTLAGVAGLLALLIAFAAPTVGQVPAGKDNPPVVKDALGDKVAVPVEPAVKIAPSKVVAVTVYPNSALVTREVEVPAGAGNVEVTVSPLPPTTINGSLYTESAEGIRVLTTRFRTRPILEDTREDVRKLQDELRTLQLAREKLEAEVKANQANAMTINKMESYLQVTTVQATEKGVLNSDSAIALAKHIRESRLDSARELVDLQQKIQINTEKAEFAQRKLKELSSGIVRTERDAVLVLDKTNAAAGKVRLNYLVESASWVPRYKFRTGAKGADPVQLEYLAAVVQQSGEDWTGVKMTLSTAAPMLNAAPPELQRLMVNVAPRTQQGALAKIPDAMDLEEQGRSLRKKAQMDLNEKKQASGSGLVNTAAALDQSFELFNPEAAMKRACALSMQEGPSVTYHLGTKFTVPSRNDEHMLEVARLELPPEFYYKATPILSQHVYKIAELSNKSPHVLLPGDATMYNGSDFVGQMNLPLVAIGERFTVGFGVDPQLQVQRQMTDKGRTTQGANQMLRYEYRLLVSSLKPEKVKLQVWDRLPVSENDAAVGVNLVKADPALSTDALYLREQRVNNLLRWDVEVDPTMIGEKALAIKYEFKMELDSKMTINSFQTAGVVGDAPAPPSFAPNPAPATPTSSGGAHPGADAAMMTKVRAAMAKLSPEDRAMAETQKFCAIDQDSLLGSTGPILKVMCKNQPVFLCCKGCEAEAKAHPEETLVQLQKMMARMAKQK